MKTITIDKARLLEALTNLAHIAATRDQYPYMVAVDHDDDEPTGRIIWANTPSSAGGYFANYRGEDNYSPADFLDYSGHQSYTWGEDPDDDECEAKWWIETNLLDQVSLDGIIYKVQYS